MVVSDTDARIRAIKFVILMGLVSLFADMTYEGARSITGPYLAFLGAGAAVTGIVAGLGEFIGYGLRVVSGDLADRTGRYWTITLLGYPKELETNKVQEIRGALPHIFWIYLVFVAISVAGYPHFQLISYHLSLSPLVSNAQIPVLFAVAMGVDALAALVVGRLFDRVGLLVLIAAPIAGIPVAPLAFSTSYEMALLGVIFWGAVMGVQETVMRAAIAGMTPIEKRGSAYGIFNAAYGLSWLLGSAAMGFLYSMSIAYVIAFSVMLELVSLVWLLGLRRGYGKQRSII